MSAPWKWVDCRAHNEGYCCYGRNGPYEGDFLGCRADAHNDWVAARFWRRWCASVRELIAKARQS